MQYEEDLMMAPPVMIPQPIIYAEATASDVPSLPLVIDQS